MYNIKLLTARSSPSDNFFSARYFKTNKHSYLKSFQNFLKVQTTTYIYFAIKRITILAANMLSNISHYKIDYKIDLSDIK